MTFRAAFAILVFGILVGCSRPAATPVGDIVPANFDDADPVAFQGQRPDRFAVHGIDVARFQQRLNWRQARANGVNFAFIKATEGGDLLDPMFAQHWQGAGEAGVARGAYHFYYFCTRPEDQARWFIRNVPRTPGALPPVLDMEWNPFSPTCAHRRPSAAVVQDEMRRFLKIIRRHYGQEPIIYTTPRFYAENNLSQFTGHEFWLRTTAKTPRETFPGQSWRFWQYSATGLINGIDGKVDLNVFSGTPPDWERWLKLRAAP